MTTCVQSYDHEYISLYIDYKYLQKHMHMQDIQLKFFIKDYNF